MVAGDSEATVSNVLMFCFHSLSTNKLLFCFRSLSTNKLFCFRSLSTNKLLFCFCSLSTNKLLLEKKMILSPAHQMTIIRVGRLSM